MGQDGNRNIFDVGALVLAACSRGDTEAKEHFSLGLAFQEEEQWQEAIAEYNASIRLDPSFAEAYGSRGSTYIKQDQHDRTINDLDEAIRGFAPKVRLAYKVGILHTKSGSVSI